MPLFRYEVIDKNNRPMPGVMNANSEAEVHQVLTSKGFVVQSIIPIGNTGKTATTASGIGRSPATGTSVYAGIVGAVQRKYRITAPPQEIAVFFRQLAQLQHAGVNLYESVERIGSQTRHHGMRTICNLMSARIQQGEQLSNCMGAHPRVFPPHIVGVIAAAELAGVMPLVLADIALDYELAQRASNKIQKIIARLLWIISFALIAAAPAIKMFIYEGMKMAGEEGQLPNIADRLARVVTPYLTYVASHILLPIIIVLVAYHGTKWVLNQPSMLYKRDMLILKIPWSSKASRERSLASFNRILYRLQNAGVLPIRAWEVASRVPENSAIAEALFRQTPTIARGGKFSEAVAATGFFSADDVRVLSTAETTGDVVGTLERISDFYQDSAKYSISRVKWAGMHIAIIFLLIAMGVAAVALMMYPIHLMDAFDKYIME